MASLSVSFSEAEYKSVNASEVSVSMLTDLFGAPEQIEFVNCPKTAGNIVQGSSENDILNNVLKQLQPCLYIYKDSHSSQSFLKSLHQDIKEHIEESVKFMTCIYGRYSPSATADNSSDLDELISELLDQYDLVESELADCFRRIAQVEMYGGDGEYVGKTTLHTLWMNFFHILTHPILKRKQPESKDGSSYLVRTNGETAFHFLAVERKKMTRGIAENQYMLKAHPNSLYTLFNRTEQVDYPYLVLEMKTSLEKSPKDSCKDEIVSRWLCSMPDDQSSTASSECQADELQQTMQSQPSSSTSAPKGKKRKRTSTPEITGSANNERISTPGQLRTQHFIQLLSVMKNSSSMYCRPTKVFGLYVDMNKVYVTCLTLENVPPLSDQLLDFILRCPFSCPGEIKYKMTISDYLDILNPAHCKTLLHLLVLIQSEQSCIRYLRNK